MNTRMWHAVFVMMGGLGTFAVFSGASGLIVGLLPRVFAAKALDQRTGVPDDGAHQWPLMARLGKSFGCLIGASRPDEDLMTRLVRAGLPYSSPAHFYGRQLAYTFLYGGCGLLILLMPSFLVHVPPLVVLLGALGFGYYGARQPDIEVEKQLKRRRRDLVVDMTYHLPRLVLHFRSLETFQKSADRFLESARCVEDEDGKRAAVHAQAATAAHQYGLEIGVAVTGFGGNLFAELLNRLAAALAANQPIEEAVAEAAAFYPRTPEVSTFLDMIKAGVQGMIPMTDRLTEFCTQLRHDLRQTQKENAARAKQIVILAAAAELMPLFMVVGAPVLLMAVQMFA